MTDNNTSLAVFPDDLITVIMFVKSQVCHSVLLLVSYVNYPKQLFKISQ